jgi:hypothetical protein
MVDDSTPLAVDPGVVETVKPVLQPTQIDTVAKYLLLQNTQSSPAEKVVHVQYGGYLTSVKVQVGGDSCRATVWAYDTNTGAFSGNPNLILLATLDNLIQSTVQTQSFEMPAPVDFTASNIEIVIDFLRNGDWVDTCWGNFFFTGTTEPIGN